MIILIRFIALCALLMFMFPSSMLPAGALVWALVLLFLAGLGVIVRWLFFSP